jgi:hypothetical protein
MKKKSGFVFLGKRFKGWYIAEFGNMLGDSGDAKAMNDPDVNTFNGHSSVSEVC